METDAQKPRRKCEDPLEGPKGFRLLTVEPTLMGTFTQKTSAQLRGPIGKTKGIKAVDGRANNLRRHRRKKLLRKCGDPLQRPKGFRLLTVESITHGDMHAKKTSANARTHLNDQRDLGG